MSREGDVPERFRAAGFTLHDRVVTLSHGSGGRASYNLLAGVFAEAFRVTDFEALDDAARLPWPGTGRLAFSTDGYTVSPWAFPGGDIGSLAVHGTVNDLTVAGARPLWISAAFILEEGFAVADLRRIVASMARAADAAGVRVVAGDTKVVPRGKADGVFIATAGVGIVEREPAPAQTRAVPGDRVIVSGYVGDHGLAVMLAREALGLETTVVSDSAPLNGLVAALAQAVGPADLHVMKDPTRGGLATTLNEIALASGVTILVDETAIPVREGVRGACEALGLDPLTLANEGKVVAVVAPHAADTALQALQAHPLGRDAAVIGTVERAGAAQVRLRTAVGGTRVLDMLIGDPLPRIC
jgi:hydrogenase expression/formation protein HypE